MHRLKIRETYIFITLIALLSAIPGLGYEPIAVTQWVNTHHHPLLDELFSFTTTLGESKGIFFCALVLLIRDYRLFFPFLVSLGLQAVLVSIGKQWLFSDSSRPILELGNRLHQVEGISIHQWKSFPSGHTATAFATFGLIAMTSYRRWQAWIWTIVAMMVGYSRLYLGQHYWLDVFAGSFIGITCAGVGIYIYHRAHYHHHLSPHS